MRGTYRTLGGVGLLSGLALIAVLSHAAAGERGQQFGESPILTLDRPLVRINEGATARNHGLFIDPDNDLPVDIAASVGEMSVSELVVSPGLYFDSGQQLGTRRVSDVALGDFDGDGAVDAFSAGFWGDDAVWVNVALGQFVGSDHPSNAVTGYALAAEDLDADGDLDIVLGSSSGVILLWNQGAGSFVSDPPRFSSSSRAVATGDLNGDGAPDLVLATGAGLLIRLNVGNGLFMDSGQQLGSLRAFDISLADLDNDSDLDIFSANYGTDSPDTVWLNDGAGGFSDSGQTLGGGWSSSVKVADLDADGDLDAFVGDGYAADTVWLNDGAGVFTDSGQLLALAMVNTRDVALLDIDQDGDLDALAATPAGIQTWLNDGAGNFSTGDQTLGSSDVESIAVADLDRNRVPDLFAGTTDGSEVWLYGSLPGSWGWSLATEDGPDQSQVVSLSALDAAGASAGIDFELIVDNVAPYVTAPLRQSVEPDVVEVIALGEFADPGDDGPWRVAVDWGDGSDEETFDLTAPGSLGSGAHAFTTVGTYRVGIRVTEDSGFGAAGDASFVIVAGNPPPEISAASPVVTVMESETALQQGVVSSLGRDPVTVSASIGELSYMPMVFSREPGVFAGASDLQLGDMDGDLDLDAVTCGGGCRVFLNDGSGRFIDSGQSFGIRARKLVLGDVNGDGALDVVLGQTNSSSSPGAQPIGIWFNDGAGSLSDSGLRIGEGLGRPLALGDLDGDGDLDAFLVNTPTAFNTVWLNDGSGHFIEAGQTSPVPSGSDIALGDLDRDGDLDAFVTARGGDCNRVWLNDGAGAFSEGSTHFVCSNNVGLADFDSDGDLDAFVAGDDAFSHNDRVLLNDGFGTFSVGPFLWRKGAGSVAVGDVDGDGDPDVLLGDSPSRLWINDGTGEFAIIEVGLPDWSLARLGDLDGQEGLDVVATHSSSEDSRGSFLNRGGMWDWSFHSTDGPDQSGEVGITATDSEGLQSVATFDLEVGNVLPSIDVADQLDAAGLWRIVDLGSFTDPGDDSPWQLSVDWGDGSPATTAAVVSPGPLGQTSHAFATAGTYAVTVSITEDGGSGFTVSAVFDVLAVDPCDAEPDFDGDGYCDLIDVCPDLVDVGQSAPPVLLHPDLDPEVSVTEYATSADGRTVVYLADEAEGAGFELFAVPVEGGASTALGAALVADGHVVNFAISPDSARVIYRADQEVDERFDLYSVAITGGTPTRLNDPTTGSVSTSFKITPDSSRVVYIADDGSSNRVPHVVPIEGGAPVLLVPAGDVSNIAISPGGNFVVFQLYPNFNTEGLDGVKYWSATIDGTALMPLGFREYYRGPLVFVPDESGVFFAVGTGISSDLLFAPLDGSPYSTYASSVPEGGIVSYQVSSVPVDGFYRVGYSWYRDAGSLNDYFTVVSAVQGQSGTLLNNSLWGNIQFSPDGRWIIGSNGRFLVGSGIFGEASASYQDTTPLTGTTIKEHAIGPNGARVVYLADREVDERFELYSASLDGAEVVKLNGALPVGGSVAEGFRISPDGASVVFVADRDAAGDRELYAVPITGGTPRALGDPRSNQRPVSPDVALTSEGPRVVFGAPRGLEFVDSLFSVGLDLDGDADGVFDECDCVPEDGSAWALPTVVDQLTLEQIADTTMLSWSTPEFAGSVVPTFDVLRTNQADSFSDLGQPSFDCVANQVPNQSATDAEVPATVFFYLVRAAQACGGGPLGPNRTAGDCVGE